MKKKLLTLVLAGVMVVGCSMPAFAADALIVDGSNPYEAGAEAKGDGWAWDGADDMTLNGYNGGAIMAFGKLVITQTGENTIKGGEDSDYGIFVMPGDQEAELTITGDGTLNVNSEGDRASAGIMVFDGDVNIEDTTVNVTVKNSNENAKPVYGIVASEGDINIDNSEVNVSATATKTDKGVVNGIVSVSESADANINIKNSNVSAEADDFAMIATGKTQGKINLENCKLKDPDQKVLDIEIPQKKSSELGQVIGTGEGKITSEEALLERAAKKVEIIADNLGKSLKDSAGKKVGSPKTADTSNVLLWSMMSLICVAAIGAATLKSRKVR